MLINNINVRLAEKILLAYLSKAGEGNSKKTMRAKFQTSFITDYGTFQKVEMNAVYSQNRAKEDNQFSEATPSGTLDMTVTAKGAYGFLKPGVKYYLDFTECEDQS